MSAIAVTALFVPVDGAYENVVAALRPVIAEVHQEPGCLLYAIHQTPSNEILMIEKWSSVQALEDHEAGDTVKRLNASLEGLLERPVQVERLVPIPAGTPQRGAL